MSKKYSVELVKSAAKEFKKLPTKVRDQVVETLGFLAQNPFSEVLKVKRLKGADDLYRTRLGDYRLVYQVHSKKLIVLVIKIGHRKDIYRKL